MDRDRFDALARLLARSGSRRETLGGLLGVTLLGQSPTAVATRRKGRGKELGQGEVLAPVVSPLRAYDEQPG
jgi:hypothetical protein